VSNAQTKCVITDAALQSWFAEHGYDTRDIASASIEIERPRTQSDTNDVSAFLTLEFYKRNKDGEYYVEDNAPARGTAVVPLKSWPLLTPITEFTGEDAR
jgi:hypothetical protein